MAFKTLTSLIQETIISLRMVSGPSTQQYAEDAIAQKLQQTYEMVRSERWWDHLMRWENHQLDGATGKIVGTISNAPNRFHDVKHIYIGSSRRELPILAANVNPYRLTGTIPRFVEPLNVIDDAEGNKLFRIWPLAAITEIDKPLRCYVRVDPPNLFTSPTVVVPFDATCLINGAAYKYAADDGTNPASVATLQNAFGERLKQLMYAHDSAVILLDPRDQTHGVDVWTEEGWL